MQDSRNIEKEISPPIKVGDSITEFFTIGPDETNTFMLLSGDTNLIHTNQEVAKKLNFDSKILHGNLLVAKLTGLIGTKLPGTGSVLVEQVIKFRSPTYENELISMEVNVESIVERANVYYISALCRTKGKICLEGKFKVQLRKLTYGQD
jgi:3-hydroxybutyryl-CoA dehydratase